MLGTTGTLLSSLTSVAVYQLNNNYILEQKRYAIKEEFIQIKTNLAGVDLAKVTYNFQQQIQNTEALTYDYPWYLNF